jgi:hypothetical protein
MMQLWKYHQKDYLTLKDVQLESNAERSSNAATDNHLVKSIAVMLAEILL